MLSYQLQLDDKKYIEFVFFVIFFFTPVNINAWLAAIWALVTSGLFY